jgi:hypothetical protein
MREARGDLGLPHEPGPELGGTRQLAGEHLQGVAPWQIRVLCQIHGAHTAGAEHALDAVPGHHRTHAQHAGFRRLDE